MGWCPMDSEGLITEWMKGKEEREGGRNCDTSVAMERQKETEGKERKEGWKEGSLNSISQMETHSFPSPPALILTPMMPLLSTRILGPCLAAPITLHIQQATGLVKAASLSQTHPLLCISLSLSQLRQLHPGSGHYNSFHWGLPSHDPSPLAPPESSSKMPISCQATAYQPLQ